MKKNNRKGFTMAELLIVVAIIAVLVAVAIPVFSAQLDKANDAVDTANARSSYAEAMSAAIADDFKTATGYDGSVFAVKGTNWNGDLPFEAAHPTSTGNYHVHVGADKSVTVVSGTAGSGS